MLLLPPGWRSEGFTSIQTPGCGLLFIPALLKYPPAYQIISIYFSRYTLKVSLCEVQIHCLLRAITLALHFFAHLWFGALVP